MFKWTPDELLQALDTRDRAALRALVAHLMRCVEAGRAYLLYRCRWFAAASMSKEDDVQQVLTVLFDDHPPPDARLLRKFGQNPGFVWREGALKAYVMGITFNVLWRSYQKRGRIRELTVKLEADLAMLDRPSLEGHTILFDLDRTMDLANAYDALSPSDRELFDMLYVQQLEPIAICERQSISSEALHARKSRLLKRLKRFLAGDRHE